MTTSPIFPPDGPAPAPRGELDIDDRSALRRVAGLSTELAEVPEVEYRQLRLERVVLVGVWTEGSAAQADASLAELARLADTAGSQVLDGLSTARRPKADPLQPLRTERGVRLAKAWDRLDPRKETVILNLIEETAGR